MALSILLSALFFNVGRADESICEREMIRAARENEIPVAVLYAVALTETGQKGVLQPYAMNIEGRPEFNANLTAAIQKFEGARQSGAKLIDIGCMQINHHFHGRKFLSLEEMFEPRHNVDYAARFLKALNRTEGSWTGAVARYHAGPGNAAAQQHYVCAVIANMIKSGFGGWTTEARTFCTGLKEVSASFR